MTMVTSTEFTKSCCTKSKGKCQVVTFKSKVRSVCLADSAPAEKTLANAMGECCAASGSEVGQKPLSPYKIKEEC